MLPPMHFIAAAAMTPSGVPEYTAGLPKEQECQNDILFPSVHANITTAQRPSQFTPLYAICGTASRRQTLCNCPRPHRFSLFVARPAELWLDMAMAHAPNHVACPAQSNQIQRTSDSQHEIHGCCWLGGLDRPRDIAIRDEPDACPRRPHVGHQLVMPRAVENQHCAIPSHMWTVTRFPYAVMSSNACLTGVHVRFHVQVPICSLSAAECCVPTVWRCEKAHC